MNFQFHVKVCGKQLPIPLKEFTSIQDEDVHGMNYSDIHGNYLKQQTESI